MRASLPAVAVVSLLVSCGLARGEKAPDIAPTAWLNTAPLTSESLRGHLVLVDFWTFG